MVWRMSTIIRHKTEKKPLDISSINGQSFLTFIFSNVGADKKEVDKNKVNKSANHYLVPGWTSVHPVPATVHTQVFQPGGIIPGVQPVFGQPHGFVATTEY